MKNLMVIFLLAVLSGNAMALGSGSETGPTLKDMAENAQLANGGYEFKSYDPAHFNKETAVAQMVKTIRDKSCGPWRKFEDRREKIALISQFDKPTADVLQHLYIQKKLVSLIGLRSNSNIECSAVHIQVFTTDGNQLNLDYLMGD